MIKLFQKIYENLGNFKFFYLNGNLSSYPEFNNQLITKVNYEIISNPVDLFLYNGCSKRFYPHYGATSNKKNTNLYKNGKTKRANPLETRPIKIKKDFAILANRKRSK